MKIDNVQTSGIYRLANFLQELEKFSRENSKACFKVSALINFIKEAEPVIVRK